MANKLKILDLSYDSFIGDCLIFLFFYFFRWGCYRYQMFSHLAFLYSFNWDHVLFILSIVEFGFYLYFFFFHFQVFLVYLVTTWENLSCVLWEQSFEIGYLINFSPSFLFYCWFDCPLFSLPRLLLAQFLTSHRYFFIQSFSL